MPGCGPMLRHHVAGGAGRKALESGPHHGTCSCCLLSACPRRPTLQPRPFRLRRDGRQGLRISARVVSARPAPARAKPVQHSLQQNHRRANTSGKAAGLAFVLLAHAALFWALWHYRLLPPAVQDVTLMVNFISPPSAPQKPEPKRPEPPKPRPTPKPVPPKTEPPRLTAQTPVIQANDYVAPEPKPTPPPPAPTAPLAPAPPQAAPAAPPAPPAPVSLSSELSVTCPDRSPPVYPGLSRRLEETGRVVLRVELSESGRVSSAQIQRSSGFARLDEAALAAVRSWHCTPPTRNGQPVKAIAHQPFNFVLDN